MRLGCGGCLTTLLGLCLVGGAVAGLAVWTSGLFEPAAASPPVVTPADGLQAQQKIYDLARRPGRRAKRRPGSSVVLTEGEINAFLTRHLGETADLPLTVIAVRLPEEDVVDLTGRLPFRALVGELWDTAGARFVPARWLDRPIWLRIEGQARLDAGSGGQRYVRVDVGRFWLGSRRVPAILVRLLFSPVALRLLRWPAPDSIESLRVHPGRVVILTPL
jgi:hypothetical protein